MAKTQSASFVMALLVPMLVLSACSDSHTMKSQGQTHWLQQCDEDSDCGELSCECGVCTAPCSAGQCEVSGVETECFEASSSAVRNLCGAQSAPALCLEPCSVSCGDDLICAGGACIPEPERIAAIDASTYDANAAPIERDGAVEFPSTDASAPDASGVEHDAQTIPELPTGSVTLGLRNVKASTIYVQTGDCNSRHRWFDLRIDGSPQDVQRSLCDCRTVDPVQGCPTPPPVCAEPVVQAIEPGEEISFTWDTGYWVPQEDHLCTNRLLANPDHVVVFRVCWLEEEPTQDELNTNVYPDDFNCADSDFRLREGFENFRVTVAD